MKFYQLLLVLKILYQSDRENNDGEYQKIQSII